MTYAYNIFNNNIKNINKPITKISEKPDGITHYTNKEPLLREVKASNTHVGLSVLYLYNILYLSISCNVFSPIYTYYSVCVCVCVCMCVCKY